MANPDRAPQFKLYKNGTAQNSTLREHFETKHKQLWIKECARVNITPKMKADKKPKVDIDSVQDEPFSLDGMMEYLLRWIAADDQVCPMFLV